MDGTAISARWVAYCPITTSGRLSIRLPATQVALDANVNVAQYATLRTAGCRRVDQCECRRPVVCHDRLQRRTIRFHVPPGDTMRQRQAIPLTTTTCSAMVQNMDGNIGRLIGTSGQPGGRRYFPPIAADRCRIRSLFSSATTAAPARHFAGRTQDRNLRRRSTCADDHYRRPRALMKEINGQAISPRFLHASRVNATASQMIHVTDLYATIVRWRTRPPMHFRATWTRRISAASSRIP